MNKSLKISLLPTTSAFFICLGMFALTMSTTFAQQGVVRMLYTVPNSTFIENPSGDSGVVTINDASSSISTLQTSINNARGANPNSIIVINLKRGAIYAVNGTGLVLGSQECLVGGGALIQAANSSVTVPLITITTGSTNVSLSGVALDGNNAGINGITGSSVARVNIDKVTVLDCGQDCILLTGKGSTTYNNELTITRCDASGSAAHAGISIQNSTQAAILDNNCHDNAVGIYTSGSAWNNIANNTCNNNTTGIDVSSGNDNVIANNTCNNNATGIHAGGTKHMIVSNSMGGNSTAGISATGSNNNFADNLFTSGNAVNFSSGGTSDNIVAYKAALSASGENYFYPPLIDNQHTTTIVNGMGRTDLTIGSTTIAGVQSQYNSARSSNPNNVIVLHLNGTFTVGSAPLELQSNTCVLLNGTIQINSSTTASAAIDCSHVEQISISGGTIDAGNNTGITGISTLDCTMIQIDSMTIQNFGSNATSIPGSDAIKFSNFGGGAPPHLVTRCYINGSAGRAIWSESPNAKALYSDNTLIGTRAGIDCDAQTFGAVCMFNTCLTNLYGIWYEQGATHNTSSGNVCQYNTRYQLDVGNNADTVGTVYNNYLCNVAEGFTGIVSGAVGANTFTSFNFMFNNVVLNGAITSSQVGTNNYFSQNYHSGGSFSTAGAETFFNSPDVDGNLQILDGNSGLGVIVKDAATTNGAAIVTAQPGALGNGTGDDEWQLIPTDSGFYKVINENSGLAMVVSGASTTNGAPIIQFAYSSGTTYNDEWWIQPAGNGLYNFINRLSGLNLDVTGASTNIGTQLDQWPANGGANQQFALVEDAPSLSPPDFTLATSPSSQAVTSGNGSSFSTTVTAANGFNGTVTFTINGLPSGASGSFSPTSVAGSGSSTLNITTSTSTPGGTYTLAVIGASGSLSHTDTVNLVVENFTISATPSSQTVTAGNGTSYTVNLGIINAFGGTIALSASGLPSGASASFNPSSLTAPGSSTMSISTSISTPACTSNLTVKGISGSLSHTANVSLTVNAPGLPGGWTDLDIGAVGIAGSASYNNGTFTVAGSGSDIWTAADQFNYAYQSVTNDTSVTARVVTETGAASFAKAAVMIRETTATNSIEASVLLTPTNGVAMEVRPTTGAATINLVGWVAGPLPPQWIKLARSGNTFTASYSVNGSTWTQLASTNVTMASTAKAGLAVTSHDNTSLNTATFDNISIVGASIDTTAIYQMENEASGLVLNNQGSLTNGSAITQWTTTTSSNLDWVFIPTTNGYYQINSVRSGLDAVVISATTTNGAGIIQWSFGSAGNDQWKPQQNSDGSYTFFNLHSGLVLEDPGSSTNRTTQMDQWSSTGGNNQKWILLKQ